MGEADESAVVKGGDQHSGGDAHRFTYIVMFDLLSVSIDPMLNLKF